jgi:hypothetical protein
MNICYVFFVHDMDHGHTNIIVTASLFLLEFIIDFSVKSNQNSEAKNNYKSVLFKKIKRKNKT